MKTVKKALSIALVAIMAMAMTACGSDSAYKKQVSKATKALKAADFESKDEEYLLSYGDGSDEAYFAETTDSEMLRSIIGTSVTDVTKDDAKTLFYGINSEKNGDESSEMNVYVIEFNEADVAEKYYKGCVGEFDAMIEDVDTIKDLIEGYNGTFVANSEDKEGHYRFCYVTVCEDFEIDSKLYVDMILEDTSLTTVYAMCDGKTGDSIEASLDSFFKEYGIEGAPELAK